MKRRHSRTSFEQNPSDTPNTDVHLNPEAPPYHPQHPVVERMTQTIVHHQDVWVMTPWGCQRQSFAFSCQYSYETSSEYSFSTATAANSVCSSQETKETTSDLWDNKAPDDESDERDDVSEADVDPTPNNIRADSATKPKPTKSKRRRRQRRKKPKDQPQPPPPTRQRRRPKSMCPPASTQSIPTRKQEFWNNLPRECYIQCKKCRWMFDHSVDFTNPSHVENCIKNQHPRKENVVNKVVLELMPQTELDESKKNRIENASGKIERKLRAVILFRESGWLPRKSGIGEYLRYAGINSVELVREINRVRQVYNVVHHEFTIRLKKAYVERFEAKCNNIVDELSRLYPRAG